MSPRAPAPCPALVPGPPAAWTGGRTDGLVTPRASAPLPGFSSPVSFLAGLPSGAGSHSSRPDDHCPKPGAGDAGDERPMCPPQATEGPRAEHETPPVTSVTTITHLVVSSLPAGPSLTVLPQPPGEGGTVGGTESGGGGRPEALTQGVGVAAQTAALAPTWAPHPRLLAIPWCVPRGPPRITAWKPWGGLRDTAHRPSCRQMGAPSTGRGPQLPAPSPQPRQGLELQWGHLCPRPSAQNISCPWRAGRAGSPCLFVRTSPSWPSHLPRRPAPCTGPHPAQKPYPPSSQGCRGRAWGGEGPHAPAERPRLGQGQPPV